MPDSNKRFNKYSGIRIRAADRTAPENTIPYAQILKRSQEKTPETIMLEEVQKIRKEMGY